MFRYHGEDIKNILSYKPGTVMPGDMIKSWITYHIEHSESSHHKDAKRLERFLNIDDNRYYSIYPYMLHGKTPSFALRREEPIDGVGFDKVSHIYFNTVINKVARNVKRRVINGTKGGNRVEFYYHGYLLGIAQQDHYWNDSNHSASYVMNMLAAEMIMKNKV